jgi:hypothetical protein
MFHVEHPTCGACLVPRFVLLQHDHPTLHWDLMLEVGTRLRTWRLAAPPSIQSPVAAEPLGDHRAIYLDYEGPVSGGRGSVQRWDGGTYDDLVEREGVTEARLEGAKIKGRCRIGREGDRCVLRLTVAGDRPAS